jgi:hypothetical protein
VPVEEIDPIQAARDLAELVAALQRIDPTGAPLGRGVTLAERAEGSTWWFDRLGGRSASEDGVGAHRRHRAAVERAAGLAPRRH